MERMYDLLSEEEAGTPNAEGTVIASYSGTSLGGISNASSTDEPRRLEEDIDSEPYEWSDEDETHTENVPRSRLPVPTRLRSASPTPHTPCFR